MWEWRSGVELNVILWIWHHHHFLLPNRFSDTLWSPSTYVHLCYECQAKGASLLAYTDASWANSLDCHSISGYVWSYAAGLISHVSKHQTVVVLSSTEAEYIATTHVTQEGLWLQALLTELHITFSSPVCVYLDNSVKTSFPLEVTPRKSGVECDWDLASPYVVHPCLHTQWSHILELVRGGDKDLSQGVNKPVRVGPSRLSE